MHLPPRRENAKQNRLSVRKDGRGRCTRTHKLGDTIKPQLPIHLHLHESRDALDLGAHGGQLPLGKLAKLLKGVKGGL